MNSNIRLKRICQYCGKEFVAKTTRTKFCGDPCAKKAYKARKRAEKIEASNIETKKLIEESVTEIQSKEFLSILEACRLTGVSRTTLWRIIKRGELKTAKFGTRVIIRIREILELFSNRIV